MNGILIACRIIAKNLTGSPNVQVSQANDISMSNNRKRYPPVPIACAIV